MKHITLGMLAIGVLAGCGTGPGYEDTRPMRYSNDMLSQTVAAATCTRGEKPFNILVAPDGSATARLVAPEVPKGQRRPVMPEFPLSLKAIDRKTVELVVASDIVTQDAVAERMSAVLKNGQAILRGDSFDCFNVSVRPAGA